MVYFLGSTGNFFIYSTCAWNEKGMASCRQLKCIITAKHLQFIILHVLYCAITLYGKRFLSSFVVVKVSVEHKLVHLKLLHSFFFFTAIWLFEKSRKEKCACTLRMKWKNGGGGGRQWGLRRTENRFSRMAFNQCESFLKLFSSQALNGNTYVARHEKLIRWSWGNVKGNDLCSSLPP